jgi:glucose-6-phosphate 1-dehydrogenase
VVPEKSSAITFELRRVFQHGIHGDRIKLGDDALRRRLHEGVNQFSRFGKAKSAAWNQFSQHIHYQQGDFKKLSTYAAPGKEYAKLEKERGTKAHRIFYMATPPRMFGEIPKYLGQARAGTQS